ncbi:tryptophan-rich antigen [Plasmodium ovale wallikeri]|uniref:Tryptophan-rich antigen n=1 Tax=Plasmodium ovale wallikeri TaxID=864142 RepID=A0A1A9A4R8_PLAOA|nr:tryptophan-rich antigen [Plasmodium ovale wallikeri]SBT57330.1 tryptophan-rich antigen [Plasmodium ovale wallikeri]
MKMCQKMEEEISYWDEWIEMMQNKWLQLNDDMNETYKSHSNNKSQTSDESNNHKEANEELKKEIERDLEYWVNEIEMNVHNFIDERWDQWKVHQMMAWLMSNWTDEEHAYRENLENGLVSEPKEIVDDFKRKWDEKINWKQQKWENWLEGKDEFITNIKNDNSLQWREDKQGLFNKWKEIFAENEINEKQ